MTAIDLLPKDDKTNGWLNILPPRQAKPPLRGERRADWLVLGAGFAGLAAARRLAELRPGEEILLLEAQAAGEGTSGRNSGFAIDIPHGIGAHLSQRPSAQRQLRIARAGVAYLERAVHDGGIACNWSRRGKYHAAVKPRGVRTALQPLRAMLEGLGEPHRWLDRDACRSELGTGYFEAAVHTPGTVLLNPAALCRGLADTLPANVTLCERSPVVEFDPANGVRVRTPEGSAFAPRAIVATNSYAGEFGIFRDRLIGMALMASLTRPLTEGERAALGSVGDWGITPASSYAGTTLRYTQDHRLLIRQHIEYRPGLRMTADELQRVRDGSHLRSLRARFPMLPELGFEHSWTGFVCLSGNRAPGFGQIAGNLWAAVCQNGIGVARGTTSGMLAAELALGEDNPLIGDMLALGQPSRLPPRPIRDWGIRLRGRYELYRNRGER
jgi:glycine/D-amino acid oxidase-like deaminating enzyme